MVRSAPARGSGRARGGRPALADVRPRRAKRSARGPGTASKAQGLDARRRGDTCQPFDWIPEVHHPLGAGEALIPGALLYYRREDRGVMLRAFVEGDRATMGPERLAAKLTAYERLHRYTAAPPPGRRLPTEPPSEEWRRRYPLFARVLFVLDGTGPAGIEARISALHAAARDLSPTAFARTVPALTASLADLRVHGPAGPVRRPVHNPESRVGWSDAAVSSGVH
ncbi:replication-relaxation family protein [Streptomyces sp. 5-8]|uniref:Replication-relaxation family protein n=1 Tax=Streptomyces musisoli TaxID=2802280 RepID=A0ABS1PBL0_9ACTN|nr:MULTISPECIES: replication-relaxation family protein [Streptomyces]MBL1109772.1 replication-relaxation family protein [Streptomyces musisoli]